MIATNNIKYRGAILTKEEKACATRTSSLQRKKLKKISEDEKIPHVYGLIVKMAIFPKAINICNAILIKIPEPEEFSTSYEKKNPG